MDFTEKARDIVKRWHESRGALDLAGDLARALEQAYTQGLEDAASLLEHSAATLAGISLAASSKEQETRFETAQFALKHSAEEIRALKPGREG
jgi:hypothetical protein